MQERKPEKIDKVLKKELENKEYKELMELQHNVKIQPELFIKETSQAVNTFKEEYNKVKAAPASKNERFIHYCSFLAHVRISTHIPYPLGFRYLPQGLGLLIRIFV
jgi:hypothetical protein